MKLGCYTKLIFTIIFVIGVGYYIIDEYVVKNFTTDIKEKLVSEFIESNFKSPYKDSVNSYLVKKINENKIDFGFIKEYAFKIKDFKEMDEKEKYLQIKKLLEKHGKQN